MRTEYFMHKEILETPHVMQKIVKNKKAICEIAEEIKRFAPVSITEVSRGTSDNAAIFGKYILEYSMKIPVSLSAFSLYTWYGKYPKLSRTLVIGISQSGETEDVCDIIKIANSENAFTLGITNRKKSTLKKLSKRTILLNAGTEKSIAATKTYTATLTVLSLLAECFGSKIDTEKAISGAEDILSREKEIAEIAERYRFANDFIVIGRGFNYASAKETALKLRETSQINATGFSSIDFLHGPLTSVSPLVPILFFIPYDETFRSNLSVLEKIKDAGGDVLVVSDKKSACEKGDVSFRIPEGETLTYPIINIVFAQLFAFHTALFKKKNPDKPEFLSKITKGV